MNALGSVSSFIWFCGLSLVFGPVAVADLPVAPYAHAGVSETGRFIAVMIPERGVDVANIHVFEVQDKGELAPFWNVRASYADDFVVAEDGASVVEIIHTLAGLRPAAEDVGLKFYRKEGEYKIYRVEELLKHGYAPPRKISSYTWLNRSEGKGWEALGNVLVIKLSDGQNLTFHINTGNLTGRN